MKIELAKKSLIISLFFVSTIIISGTSQSIAYLFILLMLFVLFDKDLSIKYDKKINFFLVFIFFNVILGVINDTKLVLLVEEIIKLNLLFFFCLVIINKVNDVDKIFNYLFYFILISVPLYPLFNLDGRFKSYFDHPNHLAYVCNILFYYFYLSFNIRFRIYKLLGTMLILLSTKSSGGILCLMFLIMFLTYKKNKIVLPIVMLAGFFLMYFGNEIPIIKDIFVKFSSFEIETISSKIDKLSFGNDTSLVWRVTYWGALLQQYEYFDIFQKLFGVGFSTMSHGNYLFSWMYTDPHNDYVRKLIESGIVGLSLFIYFCVKLTRAGNLGLLAVPLFYLPMLVGNIIVNLPFLLLFFLITFSKTKVNEQ